MQAAILIPSATWNRAKPGARFGGGFRPAFSLVLVAVLAAVCAAQVTPPIPEGYHPEKDTSVTAVNQRPDANRLMQMRRVHQDALRFSAANLERMRQLSADATRLLQLTTELNAAQEKAGEADAALTARLDTIEKLARAVKEKMKLTMGAP